ncbi:MAG: CoA ligase, partial [Burkholderiaceae bacterium]
RGDRALSRRQYLADVHALAAVLPDAGPMLNLSADRYRFAVGLGAAMLRSQSNLMPPNHTPDTVARLRTLYPTTYALLDPEATDAGLALPQVRHPVDSVPTSAPADVPTLDENTLCAQVLTSGSTGAPVPHAKHWGLLWRNTRAGAQRLARQMGRETLAGVTLVATVPPQHMYGFESTVLIALLGGAAFDRGDRSFPPTSPRHWHALRVPECW